MTGWALRELVHLDQSSHCRELQCHACDSLKQDPHPIWGLGAITVFVMVLRCGLKQWQACSSKHLFSPYCAQNLRRLSRPQSTGKSVRLSHHPRGVNLDWRVRHRTLSLTGDNTVKVKGWTSKVSRGDMETESGPDSMIGFSIPHYADLQLDRADHVRQVACVALPQYRHYPHRSGVTNRLIGCQSCRIYHSWIWRCLVRFALYVVCYCDSTLWCQQTFPFAHRSYVYIDPVMGSFL